ncbi:MAG: hypothetical protein U1F43_00485 [Myxococcota bacterium]
MRVGTEHSLEGKFAHLVYSPVGDIEGVLLTIDGAPAQVVFDHDDDESPADFEAVEPGQAIALVGTLLGPSVKGPAEHPVYAFVRLVSIDGRKPAKRQSASGAAYSGVVARFNYARHGAANGVVLDTGDFIHTKPEGLRRLKLAIGDKVEADGDAQMLANGRGWAVEATWVNGARVKR